MTTHSKPLSPEWIEKYLLSHYDGLVVIQTWGERSFFYNPDNKLPRGIYFFTIKNHDGAHDKASNLTRVDVFRCNWGISSDSFIHLFSAVPERPAKGKIIEGNYDFTELGVLTPHPIYGWMRWIAILNPTELIWEKITTLIDESYNLSVIKYNKKI